MDWIGLAEMAKDLGIPEPTLRRWAGLFKQHLSPKRFGRVTRYPLSDRETLLLVADLYAKGRVTSEILYVLKEKSKKSKASADQDDHIIITESPRLQASDQAPAPPWAAPAGLTEALLLVADQKAELAAMRADIAAMGEETAFLREEMSNQRQDFQDLQNRHDALTDEVMRVVEMSDAMGQALSELTDQAGRQAETEAGLETKLKVLEAELVRLRKEVRELTR